MADTHIVTVTDISPRTHNVKTFRVTKPQNFSFAPGQATDLSLNEEGWRDNKHPFTFTCLPEDDYLEFTIKIYENPEGLTHRLGLVQPGAQFEISDAWGAIEYKGEGVFIAGGAGVTPFISIFRSLNKQNAVGNNKLIFSNKTEDDIILKDEFEDILGQNFINVITSQSGTKYYNKRIDTDYLQNNISDFRQHFYVCGPDEFTKNILASLEQLGANADTLIFEK
ncbi:MAG TPA: flavodoxin reductase [Parafilimonas sp.]|nr:flavodoxin reductase [Parafilimonas sp.]